MTTAAAFPQAAYEAISNAVTTLAAEFPELRLSFGYIGDLTRHYDDRSWRVFTNRMTEAGPLARSASFGYHATERLPDLLARVERGDLEAFCQRAMTLPTR